jgi:hypothetical protein
MMKQYTLIFGILCLLAVAALIAAGCTMTPGGTTTPAPVQPTVVTAVPSETPVQAVCGFTSCHGLDLACGIHAPMMCTMEYRIGDRCRQHATCDTGGGGCSLAISPEFTACKACVEKCQIAAGADSLAAFSCEEKC